MGRLAQCHVECGVLPSRPPHAVQGGLPHHLNERRVGLLGHGAAEEGGGAGSKDEFEAASGKVRLG